MLLQRQNEVSHPRPPWKYARQECDTTSGESSVSGDSRGLLEIRHDRDRVMVALDQDAGLTRALVRFRSVDGQVTTSQGERQQITPARGCFSESEKGSLFFLAAAVKLICPRSVAV